MNPVIIDTNLLVLLIVGSTDPSRIAKHKRLRDYTAQDFDTLVKIIGEFSEIVMLPHVMAEFSNLTRQISDPRLTEIQTSLRTLIEATGEISVTSLEAVAYPAYNDLGLADAAIPHLCTASPGGILFTLLTADAGLANAASSVGCDVLDFADLR